MTLPIVNNQSLINFLRKQDPNKRYAYTDNQNCVLCQFFKSYGFHDIKVTDDMYFLDGTMKTAKKLPEGWNDVACGQDRAPYDIGPDAEIFGERTMGSAYKRALEMLD